MHNYHRAGRSATRNRFAHYRDLPARYRGKRIIPDEDELEYTYQDAKRSLETLLVHFDVRFELHGEGQIILANLAREILDVLEEEVAA
jgi:hypothetical protein